MKIYFGHNSSGARRNKINSRIHPQGRAYNTNITLEDKKYMLSLSKTPTSESFYFRVSLRTLEYSLMSYNFTIF